jgi:hypothetical protein
VIILVVQPREVRRTIEEMKVFDVPKRIREALEGLEKEFKDYEINNVSVGIEAGFPSGFKGSVQVTLKKK